jgi:hypothetical protein
MMTNDDFVPCMMGVQPQVEVKSFPAEPITPLAANHSGTYLVGGGLSGDIYLWEVSFLLWCIINLLCFKGMFQIDG